MQYQNQQITVIGLGKTGLSCVDFLLAKQANVRVIDTRKHPAGADKLPKNVPLHTGSLNQQWLLDSDLIVISPGLALKTPEIQTAIQAGVDVVGDIELFCREAVAPIIAITGSNGKSTVTTLVTEMAKAAGIKVAMGGNIGIPALSLLEKGYDLYVLELSSFQLETTDSLQAISATVLNVTEDHMNRYVDLEDYRQAKLKIYAGAKTAVINAEDPLTLTEGLQNQLSFAEKNADYWLKTENGKSYLMAKDQMVLPCEEMKLVGRHNYMNALASIALAQAAGVDMEGIRRALREFAGLDHRFQLAHFAHGVRWINDSKATNVGSTVAALTGLNVEGKLHLLLGGDGKGADFSELQSLINQPHIYCYCFGQDGAQLSQLSAQSHLFETMEQAIQYLRPTLQAGDIVLLSPACASLDQFSCFEARGDEFTRLAKLS
ncbi:UDP-N-acetylmuramoyl-L-alanine--D-glutamate ligase [[Haemophilus] felis]|uniref:UDP-N-acetylmuramoylalanine--D-glutamate ligase n=1 Tax=[Haemophilus] felis TaxID=123822 RepID=A0A1T0BBV7_9PAST|nr:UDP-N-acetylmuramoyl-L-alanine--D-glutamate ligase [[Haemophilus] felis]NBI40007.1 UDP-N-acetylmuramoyl-L-alanine--D-glutamate ligase [[Haemophilus] felis]OOS07615.1 UDP-N-acetylmuramoyl-L-alanine--D-glutamate ligase [[Haemophilus] felis]